MFPFKRKSLLEKFQVKFNEGERWFFSSKQAKCVMCGQWGQGADDLSDGLSGLCQVCRTAIPWIENIACYTCGRAIRCYDCARRKEASLIYNRSAVNYDDTMKAWLGQYKFRKNERLAALFISMMHRPLLRMIEELAEREQTINYITYIPLSEQRMEERGFNQAEVIARGLADLTRIDTIPLLNRMKHTNKQSYKNRAARLHDLKGAFVFNEQMAVKPCDKPNIVLVDDVYTTGSTMHECANVITSTMSAHVYGLTWAR